LSAKRWQKQKKSDIKPSKIYSSISTLGNKAKAVTVEEAAKFGDVVLISIPFGKYKSLPANGFKGKIVIDSNNYYPSRDGNFPELDQGKTTSSELLAEHLRGARIVKAFNTIWFEHLKSKGNTSLPIEDRRAIFFAGDDAEANHVVSKLIEEIGFAAVDTGSLHEGGKAQQPGTPIYNKELTATQAMIVLSNQ
jgi:8-hydroxy-5-deazaflavin:NADPH oxidoreductase